MSIVSREFQRLVNFLAVSSRLTGFTRFMERSYFLFSFPFQIAFTHLQINLITVLNIKSTEIKHEFIVNKTMHVSSLKSVQFSLI